MNVAIFIRRPCWLEVGKDAAEAMVQVQVQVLVLVLLKQVLQQRIALIRSGFSRR
jgi:ABC-type uncharacterized transport system permease subunit